MGGVGPRGCSGRILGSPVMMAEALRNDSGTASDHDARDTRFGTAIRKSILAVLASVLN